MISAADIANALRWEWFRLSRRAGLWVILGLVAVAVAGVVVVTVVVQNAVASGFSIPSNGFPLLVFEVLSRLGPFLGIILAAIVFGGDFGWGTLRPLLARGQARWLMALVKLILPGVILGIVWMVAWTLAAVVGLAAGEPSAGALEFLADSPDDWPGTVGRFFSAWPVAITYLGLAALLCALGRSTAFGVGVAVAIVLVEAVAYPIAGIIAELALDFSLDEYTRWTLRGVTDGLMGRDDDFGPWVFLPATAAYLALFWGLTLAVIARRDVSSGNG